MLSSAAAAAAAMAGSVSLASLSAWLDSQLQRWTIDSNTSSAGDFHVTDVAVVLPYSAGSSSSNIMYGPDGQHDMQHVGASKLIRSSLYNNQLTDKPTDLSCKTSNAAALIKLYHHHY